MTGLFYDTGSVIHRSPAGLKITALAFLGTLLFIFESLVAVGGFLGIIIFLYWLARIPLKMMVDQIRPVFWILGLIFIAQVVMIGWETGMLVVGRFAVLILAAGLVTLSTMTSDMIAALEAGMSPFRRWLPIEKISLAISLALRFIPLIREVTGDVREAQRARGLERNIFALAVPVVIRTLKTGTEVAEALDARGFGSQDG